MAERKSGAVPGGTGRPQDDRQQQHSTTAAREIERFVACSFEPGDIVEVRVLPPGQRRGGKSTWHTAGELPAQAARLLAENAKGQNIYVGANPRKQTGGTKAGDVALARCLVGDSDGGTTETEARQRWEAAGLPEPNLLLHSGHGIHVWWRLATPMLDLGAWTALQRTLIAAVGSDTSIHDPPRIMRLPGFQNCKKRPWVPCRIISAEPSRRYELAQLSAALSKAAPPTNGRPSDRNGEHKCAAGLSDVASATAYLAKIPGASEGGRNSQAFRAACTLVQDFGLTDADALPLLERWDCEANTPPLGTEELRSVLANARKYASKPAGNKLAAQAKRPAKQEDSDIEDEGEPWANEDPWPDPLAPEAFYGVAGEIVRTIEPHSEADPAALLVQLLTGVGNLIGREAHFRAEGDRHSANLFCCPVGTTSKGRKGTSWGQVDRVLCRVDEQWAASRVLSGLSSGEGLIWAVRDPIVKREPIKQNGKVVDYQEVEVDPGIADKRLLVMESELGSVLRVLRRESNTLSAVVRNAWDKSSLRTLTKNSPAVATGCHISIIGHITRNELRRHLTETDMANGFANRFLWICAKRSKCLPEGGRLRMDDLEPAIEQLRCAAAFSQQIGELRRDSQAREVWAAVYPTLSAGQAGLLGAVTSRAEAQVMRLALIYAVLDQSTEISAEHLMAALAVWQYAEASARHIFGSALGDPTADEILRALRAAPNGLTRTELWEHFGRHKSSEEIGRALGVLAEGGLAHRQVQETKGRPAERWFCT